MSASACTELLYAQCSALLIIKAFLADDADHYIYFFLVMYFHFSLITHNYEYGSMDADYRQNDIFSVEESATIHVIQILLGY